MPARIAFSRTPSIIAVKVLRVKPSTRCGRLESTYTMRGETRTLRSPARSISGRARGRCWRCRRRWSSTWQRIASCGIALGVEVGRAVVALDDGHCSTGLQHCFQPLERLERPGQCSSTKQINTWSKDARSKGRAKMSACSKRTLRGRPPDLGFRRGEQFGRDVHRDDARPGCGAQGHGLRADAAARLEHRGSVR